MPPLSDLLAAGAENARLHFGMDGEAVSAAELARSGQRYYRSSASTDTVAILMTNDRATVEVVLAAVAAGVKVVSLPLPPRAADLDAYLHLLRTACAQQGAQEVIVRDDAVGLLEGSGLAVRGHADLGRRPLAAPASGGFELVQFSSGSTSSPKPVQLDDEALGANVSAVLEVLAPQAGDGALSWLPLSHDMGLIGMLLAAIAGKHHSMAGESEVVLLDPAHFLHRPAAWLSAMAHWRTAITAAPDFGFRLCLQRGAQVSGDLSRLRCAIVGGEVIRASTLQAFTQAYESSGFTGEAFCPAYGMAELGVAATLTPMAERWSELPVDLPSLSEHRVVPAAGEGGDSIVLVASGPPLPGYELRIDGADDVGPVCVRGPSIAVDGATGKSFGADDGWYSTGDVGFLHDDVVFVSGRADDYIVARGRNVYAPSLEDAIARVPGVRAGRVAAVGLPTGDWVVVVEPRSGQTLGSAEREHLRREIAREAVGVASAHPVDVVIAEQGALPFTASGKLQRRETVKRYLAQELG